MAVPTPNPPPDLKPAPSPANTSPVLCPGSLDATYFSGTRTIVTSMEEDDIFKKYIPVAFSTTFEGPAPNLQLLEPIAPSPTPPVDFKKIPPPAPPPESEPGPSPPDPLPDLLKPSNSLDPPDPQPEFAAISMPLPPLNSKCFPPPDPIPVFKPSSLLGPPDPPPGTNSEEMWYIRLSLLNLRPHQPSHHQHLTPCSRRTRA